MRLLYRPNRTAKNAKCYVIEVDDKDWFDAPLAPVSSEIKGKVIWIGDKFDNSANRLYLGQIGGFCNPFYDLINYWNSDFNGLIPLGHKTFHEEFVDKNIGAYLKE